MLLRIHPENQSERQIRLITECLSDGGIIIYPTDTVYGIGCDIFKSKAVERIAAIKGIKPEKARFSFICHSLSQLSDFCLPINNNIFKMMKANLPGPFTFILQANSKVPKLIQSKKKTVGIRIPDNQIPLEIVKMLEHPIMSASIHDEDDIIEYTSDPELIYEKYQNIVDIVIDGGYGGNEVSTIIDCTSGDAEIIRQGKGILN
jgi:tRNA threonylcarbamoyl adenosine modification protein (Sua5/YciO/YrdC/YwlC family)